LRKRRGKSRAREKRKKDADGNLKKPEKNGREKKDGKILSRYLKRRTTTMMVLRLMLSRFPPLVLMTKPKEIPTFWQCLMISLAQCWKTQNTSRRMKENLQINHQNIHQKNHPANILLLVTAAVNMLMTKVPPKVITIDQMSVRLPRDTANIPPAERKINLIPIKVRIPHIDQGVVGRPVNTILEVAALPVSTIQRKAHARVILRMAPASLSHHPQLIAIGRVRRRAPRVRTTRAVISQALTCRLRMREGPLVPSSGGSPSTTVGKPLLS
jgi:hypothetical protein